MDIDHNVVRELSAAYLSITIQDHNTRNERRRRKKMVLLSAPQSIHVHRIRYLLNLFRYRRAKGSRADKHRKENHTHTHKKYAKIERDMETVEYTYVFMYNNDSDTITAFFPIFSPSLLIYFFLSLSSVCYVTLLSHNR